MTSVMPRPFDQIKWALNSVEEALKKSDGEQRIPQEALQTFKNFGQAFSADRNQMKDAMAQEIRWMSDGRSFPGGIGPNRPAPLKYDDAEKYHLSIAGTLQSAYRKFAAVLDRADNDRVLSYAESQELTGLMIGLKAGIETLVDGVDNLRESKANNKPAYEILQTIKNAVNETSNDTAFGPFGMLTKFGKAEAQAFVDMLGWQVTDWQKKQEVVETLYDTAASPYGNLVLNQAAADVFKNAFQIDGVNWDKAVNAYKEEHPIVALYAVVIDREIASGNGNVRELEAMLRAGEAAHAELSVGFIRHGVVAPAGVTLSAANAAATAMSRPERAGHVEALSTSLAALRARIAELRG